LGLLVWKLLEGKRIAERKMLKGKTAEGKRIVEGKMLQRGLIESLHQELYHRLQKAKLRKNFMHRP
jgi:hypothetical protein